MHIPRPTTEQAARYNPGRWICALPVKICNGIFMVYGQEMKCPLYDKCKQYPQSTMYEYPMGHRSHGQYKLYNQVVNPEPEKRNHERDKRQTALYYVFNPEYIREKRRDHAARNAEYIREYKREWSRKRTLARQEERSKIKTHQTLPCGEDCEFGCPYDNGYCPYGDREEDEARKRVRIKDPEARHRTYVAYVERQKEDPELWEAFKAKRREINRRYYQNHSQEMRDRAKKQRSLKRSDWQPPGYGKRDEETGKFLPMTEEERNERDEELRRTAKQRYKKNNDRRKELLAQKPIEVQEEIKVKRSLYISEYGRANRERLNEYKRAWREQRRKEGKKVT